LDPLGLLFAIFTDGHAQDAPQDRRSRYGCKEAHRSNPLRHSLTVLVAEVPVNAHGEGAAVLVSQPAGKGGDVDSTLYASRRKPVPQVMVAEVLDGDADLRQ
jgi:hypothetical protein